MGITILAIALIYYTPYWLLLIPAIIVVNYLVLSKILLSRKRKHILTQLIRPSLWLLILYSYLYTIHAIFLMPIVWFALVAIAIGVGYAVLLMQELRSEPKILIDNILQIILIVLWLSLASLMLAYWHVSTVLTMVAVWLVVFYLSLTWLLDFTNQPYVIASVWSLIVLELFWITSRWINLYHIPQTALLVSQSALIVGALAYGFGGLYYHYKNKTLRKSLLFEYIGVTTVVFVALMLLSKWAVAL